MEKELNPLDLAELQLIVDKLMKISKKSGMDISITSLLSPSRKAKFATAYITPEQKMLRNPSLYLKFDNGNVTAELMETHPCITNTELFINKDWGTQDLIDTSKKFNELIKRMEEYEHEHFGRDY